MSILILDPQEQFYEDNNVLPSGKLFKDEIKRTGMNYQKYKVPASVILPDNAKLFSELLLNYGFIKDAFDILSEDKTKEMGESIERYVSDRITYGERIGNDPKKLFRDMMDYFLNEKNPRDREPLLKRVYSGKKLY